MYAARLVGFLCSTFVTRHAYHHGYFDGDEREFRGLGWSDQSSGARALRLDDTTLPDELSVEEGREACRALKGEMLRQEVYALDGPVFFAHRRGAGSNERCPFSRTLCPWPCR